ncbi:hypothetical protein A1F97_11257, partial [Pyrenophora tritici-repentis]
MATIQTQRDATVILTDSSNWIPCRKAFGHCWTPKECDSSASNRRLRYPQTFRSMNRQVAPQLPHRIPPETLDATREDQHKTLQKCRQQPHKSPLYQRECQNSQRKDKK